MSRASFLTSMSFLAALGTTSFFAFTGMINSPVFCESANTWPRARLANHLSVTLSAQGPARGKAALAGKGSGNVHFKVTDVSAQTLIQTNVLFHLSRLPVPSCFVCACFWDTTIFLCVLL